MTANDEFLSLTDDQRRDMMKAPDEGSAMLRLKALGWGSKRIAAELGCARNTVRRWLKEATETPCVNVLSLESACRVGASGLKDALRRCGGLSLP